MQTRQVVAEPTNAAGTSTCRLSSKSPWTTTICARGTAYDKPPIEKLQGIANPPRKLPNKRLGPARAVGRSEGEETALPANRACASGVCAGVTIEAENSHKTPRRSGTGDDRQRKRWEQDVTSRVGGLHLLGQVFVDSAAGGGIR